jgi:hypothetical protein
MVNYLILARSLMTNPTLRRAPSRNAPAWALGVALLLASGAAAESAPSLTATPAEVALAAEESSDVLVVAKVGSLEVQSLVLSGFGDRGVSVEVEEPRQRRPTSQGDAHWKVTLRRSRADLTSGKVFLRADYQLGGGAGAAAEGVVVGTVSVSERLPENVEKLFSATLVAGFESLQDRQERPLYVVVKNLSPVPLTVTGIELLTIGQVAPHRRFTMPTVLPPRGGRAFEFQLQAGDALPAGKHLLLAQVEGSWERAGLAGSGTVIEQREFTAGVFGESAILEATAIPSVLLLPGFLMLTAFGLPWGWTWKEDKAKEGSWHKDILDLDFKKPGFWSLAITLSLAVALIYPLLTGRSLVQAYGFKDIYLLWFGSVVVGMVAFGLGSFGRLAYLRHQASKEAQRARADEQRKRERTPHPNDQPLDLLRKIARVSEEFEIKPVRYPRGGEQDPVFLLDLPWAEPSPADEVWVAPKVRPEWRSDDDEVRDELTTLQEGKAKVAALIEKLDAWSAAQGPLKELRWNRRHPDVQVPTRLKREAIDDAGPEVWI